MSEGEGEWLTISELARLRGVDKSAISRRVTKYEERGLLSARIVAGRGKLVNVAEFDRVAGSVTDAVRELNGAAGGASASPTSPGAALPGDPILAREQARRAALDADMKQLDLDERLGQLIRVDNVRDAMARCSRAIIRVIDQMPSRAEAVAAAVAKDGVQGARAALRELARLQREELARSMTIEADADDADVVELLEPAAS